MEGRSVPGTVPATGDTEMNGTHCPLVPAPPCPPFPFLGPNLRTLHWRGAPGTELCGERHGLGAREAEALGSRPPLPAYLTLATLWPKVPHCWTR